MAPNQPPKNRGGRPRKHSNDEAIAKAVKESKRRSYYRSRQQSRQPAGPVAFIAYEPLHLDVPTNTPPEIGLRTSPDIRIPRGDYVQQSEVPPGKDPQGAGLHTPPPTQLPLHHEDPEIALQIKHIQKEEQELNMEREEHDAEIAEILMGMRAAEQVEHIDRGKLDVRETANEAGAANIPDMSGLQTVARAEEEGMGEEESQRSCFLNFGDIDEPIMGNDNSIAASHTSNRSASIQRSFEGRVPSQTPTQHSSPSMQSSNKSNSRKPTSRRSTSFPTQKNNLLSWMKSLPGGPPSNLSSPSNAPSLPFRRIESFAPSSPAQSVTPALPLAAATATPAPAPVATASPNATVPDAATSAYTEASLAPTERTAFKLAKQLWNFQGCTHEQHREADQLHLEHHQRPDVHSKCSSLHEVTAVLRGNDGGARLPDVLSSGKLMKPMDFSGLDCQAAFEGTSSLAAPEDIGTRNENLPRSLCLSQQHSSSRKNRPTRVSFDIDSTCCFPTSLAVARQGINWFPKPHSFLNLTADIHFGLRVPFYGKRGVLTQKYEPLHKIPHYCFGSVTGMELLLLFIFFPALHIESSYEHTTYLSKEDYELFYDGILSPAINKTIQSSNILQHYPATARIASIDSTALSAESLARKDSSREQLLKYALQPQYLDALWNLILQTIAENPGYQRFQGATLFMHSKNTKLESMNVTGDLTTTYEGWEHSWSQATDPQFYNKDRTFVDLAKQTTSEDSALPYDQIPDDNEAEVFLWKRCCLDAYAKTRTVLNADGSPAKGNPKRTTYPWATMRDTMGQTFFAAPQGNECRDGLIYSQFYALIKTPFDTSKVYVFDNDSLENLALDPGYIRSLQQEGGGITFSKGVCEFGYLHSKKRAHANLVDNQWKSYGIREEHRISLAIMEEIAQQWRQWDLYDDEMSATSPLPYYIVPTKELLGFLYAQINKYCFLFENVLAHTAMTYSLPETIVMVAALRALRFCYGSNLLQRESLLYKDRWESLRGHKPVVKEGLGMRDTMERCGLGWFLPKFNWATFRLAPPHGENLLVGNMLMHEEYKRRWRAVKDLRDVYVRFNQADSWYNRYHVQQSRALSNKWLEYLHALNLEQFDTDLWKAMLKSDKRCSEIKPEAIKNRADMQFCYHDMKGIFSIGGASSPPHFVTGNKMRFEKVTDLLNFLFLWDDDQQRSGWGSKPYRVILQKSFVLIEQRLGYQIADQWLDEFFHLIRLTHWVLPYPSNSAFITTTKTNRNQGLQGRMMWFSAVYADPARVDLPFRSQPCTLYNILWRARQQAFGDGRDQRAWCSMKLIAACQAEDLKVCGQEETEDYWVVGKRSIGLKGFAPVWERTQPPKLEMLELIKGKTLDELEDLMGSLSQEHANNDAEADNVSQMSEEIIQRAGAGNETSSVVSSSRGKSIMAAFARRPNDDRSTENELNDTALLGGNSSGSEFLPSNSDT